MARIGLVSGPSQFIPALLALGVTCTFAQARLIQLERPRLHQLAASLRILHDYVLAFVPRCGLHELMMRFAMKASSERSSFTHGGSLGLPAKSLLGIRSPVGGMVVHDYVLAFVPRCGLHE